MEKNEQMRNIFYELLVKTSTQLPADVLHALKNTVSEVHGSTAAYALAIIDENIQLAQKNLGPLCQDTGTILFYVDLPRTMGQKMIQEEAYEAIIKATQEGVLRQNSVDSLTGHNTGNNLGKNHPCFYFSESLDHTFQVRLILKGGGCENVSAQYSLPYNELSAGRDLEGVRKVILHAIWKAQGQGCAPGFLGVCVGGDRQSSHAFAKKQLLRAVDDSNPDPVLAKLEDDIVKSAHQLGIGPMGLGGKTTILGCKICDINRLPASYFVSISYMCWAFRRQGVAIDSQSMKIIKWLY